MGDQGVASFIGTFLVAPVNAYLRSLVGHLGHALYWRASADHSGFHLVWERPRDDEHDLPEDEMYGNARGRRSPVDCQLILAVLVVHSDDVSTDTTRSRVSSLGSAINNGYVYIDDSGTMVDESDDGVDTFPLAQVLLEMYKHDAHFGIVTNYHHFMVCQRISNNDGTGQAATTGSVGNDEVGEPVIPIVEFNSPARVGKLSMRNMLASHPSGLLVGITVLAVSHDPVLGPLLGFPEQDPTSYGDRAPKRVRTVPSSGFSFGSVLLSIPGPTSPSANTHRPTTQVNAGRTLVWIIDCEHGPLFSAPPNDNPMDLTHPSRGTIALLYSLGESALWQASRALLFPPGTQTPIPVVAKILDLGLFPTEGDSQYSRKEAHDAALNEAAAMGALVELQGQVVPRYYGLGDVKKVADEGPDPPAPLIDCEFARGLCAVMEDVDRRLHRTERASPVTRRAIRELYRAIHARGVLHIDIEWRHIRRRNNGTLALIDFDRAIIRSDEDDTTWARNCEEEMRRVNELLWERR